MKTKYTVLSEPIKILRRLQKFGYTSAIIAGGAIRDDYTGQQISDYDIFLWDPRHSSEFKNKRDPVTFQPLMDLKSDIFEMERTTEFVELLQTLDLDCVFQESLYGPLVTGDGDALDMPGIGAQLSGIWEAWIDDRKYQLIYTTIEPVGHVEVNFDIGLCKAYCDGVKLRYTADFMTDIQNNTFTIVGQGMTQDQFNYAIDHHVDKLKHKYPHYRLEVAPHNQKLYDAYKNS